MGNREDPSPYEAQDAAGFVESMRQLKERAGLTYRELEERAARNGDVLARSTLADILRRKSLPRPDLLAAFVRACGDARRTGAWLEARDRIAADSAAAPPTDTAQASEAAPRPPAHPSTAVRRRWTTRRMVVATTGLLLPLSAVVLWMLLPDSSDGPGRQAADAGALRAPTDGWVTIRIARAPELCLTDGRDRRGAYADAVAVQLPCARAPVPRTYLEPAGEGLYRVQWHHPQQGKGCLTVMSTGPVKGMLEPRDNCGGATLFHVEATAGGHRLRPNHSSQCVGISGDETNEAAEAILERCTGAADQRFLIRPG
ncbi:helix-turn-helix domain-containing protein [Streptomyces albidochromogenes]|uniref:helix-turn-helix domain-containing protein n=1 Tax=Streptomyces albidochromogenes TaxID=329524 RepID=UPI001FCB272C|nr:helix-turn-helix domain-containing protein [Streptomyces albidochromogenes]